MKASAICRILSRFRAAGLALLVSYLTEVVRVSLPTLPYDHVAATRHALERVELERTGTPGPFVDGQIAAIALVNNLILVTRNTLDFKRYEDLIVEDWSV
jgi:tRNA(fMet)-specific endonuclease VapC